MAVTIDMHYIMLAKTENRKLFGSLNTDLGNSKINAVICSEVRWIDDVICSDVRLIKMNECGVQMQGKANMVIGRLFI